jgi:hypothetical protein
LAIKENDKLFCEIGIDLGLITEEQKNEAFEKQKVDFNIGEDKPIGAYFYEAKVLEKEQIAQIIKVQEKYAKKANAEKGTEEILKQIKKNLQCEWIFIKPDISDEKLKRSLAICEEKVTKEDVLLLMDDSVDDETLAGMVITKDKVYCRNLEEELWELELGKISVLALETGFTRSDFVFNEKFKLEIRNLEEETIEGLRLFFKVRTKAKDESDDEKEGNHSFEKGYCPDCGDVGVKVVKKENSLANVGCFGWTIHLFLALITSGLWFSVIFGSWLYSKFCPNLTKTCMECAKVLVKVDD